MPELGFVQPRLDGLGDDPLGLDLSKVTFVVLDLETTGNPPTAGGAITEVGAVKVRGGQQLGEFGTLVNPGGPVPPFITVLTGITTAMVTKAPPIERVLPSLLEFLGDAVLVAHNAPYDVGFLRAACDAHGYRWQRPVVLDTAALARRLLVEEVRDRRLATLADYFRTSVRPTHRALDDARATVEVLHALIGRLGSHRVHTLRDTIEYVRAVSPEQRRKRHLADGLPHAPGVYIFRGADDRVLYVGTSVDVATRVRSYFTAAEKRARIKEMLAAADRVEAVECAHPLEAAVRELRLIAAHAPPYNRRSRNPGRVWWLKLTVEPYPRLSVVRKVGADAGAATGPGASGPGATYLGPFSSRRSAEAAAAGVYDAVPLRQCAARLSRRRPSPACALAELGRCGAPCEHAVSVEAYESSAAQPVREAFVGDPEPVVAALRGRMDSLSATGRFEDAARVRDRLRVLLRACIRAQRLAALTSIEQLCAARPEHGGWELAVVRHGRLAAAGFAAPGVAPRPVLAAVTATAETVLPGPGPVPCASAEETDRILSWLEQPETRLVEVSQGWASPVRGAARFGALLASAAPAR